MSITQMFMSIKSLPIKMKKDYARGGLKSELSAGFGK